LTELNLEGNQIRDIRPLLANTGLSEGDIVTLRYNPLSPTMMEVYIPQLEQRGVTVILEE
jgi:Leucine-rich repeat (LRR) protein